MQVRREPSAHIRDIVEAVHVEELLVQVAVNTSIFPFHSFFSATT
jgi:hypothetical protein